jgi:hypothetical protein
MQLLLDKDKTLAEKYIEKAKILAKKATCKRAKCGAVLVKDGEIIGEGFNSPPGNDENERRCEIKKDEFDKKVTDKTCCVHAEQRAVMDALHNNLDKIKGSKLYFARFYPDGELRLNGGNGGKNQLYCTVCTKIMFDVGIAEFILPNVKGIAAYAKNEYLSRSYDYGKYAGK